MNKVQRDIDRIAAQYDKAVTALIHAARAKYVIPYCDKHGLKFISGMGIYCFLKSGESWEKFNIWGANSGHLPKRLRDVLDVNVHTSENCIGSLMEEYTAPTYSPNKT